MKYSLLIFLTVLAVVPGARGQAIHSGAGFSVSIGGGHAEPDNNRNLDGDSFGSLGAGYRFGAHWGAEITAARGGLDGDATHSNADLNHLRLDAVYNFRNGRWQPYLSGGIARSNYDYAHANNSGDSQLSAGGGLKYFMTPGLFLRADLRALQGTDNTDAMYTVSLGYLFGQSAVQTQPVAAQVDSDGDGDGVSGQSDHCPNTPSGAPIDTNGCALDSDGDGVADYRDECPATKPEARVDEHGCYVILERQVQFRLHVAFPFNSATIPQHYRGEVAKLAEFLKAYPQTEATIEGHTDSMGPSAYNKTFSEQRAAAVVNMLVEDFGIDRQRLVSVGYGETRPIADNDTEQGREKNRRVVAVIKATVTQQQ